MKKLISIVSILIFFAFGASVANACVCVFTKPSDSLKSTDAIFVGKITKVLKAKRKWLVRVSSVIKGDIPETITFYASMVGTSCESSDFNLNETYVFFANKIQADEVAHYENGNIMRDEKVKIGNYEPETCSWTSTLTQWKSEDYRKQLQEYKDEDFLKIINTGKKPKVIKGKKGSKKL